jgi:hypothetical protein
MIAETEVAQELLAEFRPALKASGKAGTEAEVYLDDNGLLYSRLLFKSEGSGRIAICTLR